MKEKNDGYVGMPLLRDRDGTDLRMQRGWLEFSDTHS